MTAVMERHATLVTWVVGLLAAAVASCGQIRVLAAEPNNLVTPDLIFLPDPSVPTYPCSLPYLLS
ncbi:hypothetical protein PAXRUDRAFT_826137 [Paxillus rubicundulus Ve08.2h10]|uniref:Uncharacterized protein n=1 Tax=Paxillus rubicundulus Ve08.2h10 TaxID=930991 RepID=A0A0D0DF53_9AGAM|nr:hypothetical protein PAXRUDRAFT_826137 [Paxillus rubicundulus Ve08.2h10]